MKIFAVLVLASSALAAPSRPRYEYTPAPTYRPAPTYAPPQPTYVPAPTYAPAPSYRPAPSYEAPAQYGLDWAVKDDYSGNDFGQQENRNGYDTQGSYYVQLPDGRRQKVTYYVNGDSGYVAEVTYEGEAQYPTYQPSYKPSPVYKPAPSYRPAPSYTPAPLYV